MEHRGEKILEWVLFAMVAVCILAVLLLADASKNQVTKAADGSYIALWDMEYREYQSPDAPMGVVEEYSTTLGDVSLANTFAFYVNHNEVAVWLGDSCVYRLTTSDSAIRTPGETWVLIPLSREDAGKTLRVELMPVYSDYRVEPEFLYGSDLAIFRSALYQAIPELLLSIGVVLVGVLLLCLAIHHSARKTPSFRIYATGMLAISAGVWKATYGKFLYFVFPGHSVLIYTASVVSLMTLALSMLNCVEPKENEKERKFLHIVSIGYCLLDVTQLMLQFFGVLDLRQLLKLTHITIAVSAVILVVDGLIELLRKRQRSLKFSQQNFAWIIGAGAFTDLVLYYFGVSGTGMLFVVGSIFCYAMLEGVRLVVSYTESENALKEMQLQLELSHTRSLMGQIRSHFVFNVLNAISGMCKYDPEKADDTIVRFSRYLRANIDILESDHSIPFTMDLERLEDYVLLEQVRFGDKLEFVTDIGTDQFLIPPMILQPVVENAIKHGIRGRSTGGTVTLATREVGESIVITIKDDGVGFRPEALTEATGVGLKNIRFRLRQMAKGSLDIQSQPGQGTCVTITIPREGSVCI